MNKNCKLTIGAMLLLTTAFSVAEVRAQTCVVPPTCEGLGYDKTASDCGGLAKLRCPFDDSKYFCTAYMNPDGSAPIAVGDIAYSDGTYSAVPIPSKIPVGVVVNSSGLVISLIPYKTNLDDLTNVSATMCSSFSANATTGWKNPTKEELLTIYANRTKINATLSTLATISLGSGKYIFSAGNRCHDYVYFSDGKAYFGTCHINNDGIMRCVNMLGNLANGAGTSTYKVGDTYVKDGVALGKVVEVDSTGKHGYIAISGGNATGSDASAVCASKSSGGLNWTLSTGEHACKIIKSAGMSDECSYSSWANITCGVHSTSAPGACNGGSWTTCPKAAEHNRRNCSALDTLSFVCEAPF